MSLLTLVHAIQSLTAAYTSIYSYTSIRKVQTYEDMTKKVAKYSNIAESQLRTTTSTMAAGAGATVSSFALSTYLLLSTGSGSPATAGVLAAVVGVGISAAHSHISNFWRGKSKVPLPGSGDYNDAISTANWMRQLLGGLAASWGVVTIWYLVAWISG